MKKSTMFYLKRGVDPEKYGFVKSQGGWSYRVKGIRSGLDIDEFTGRIAPYAGFSSANVAIMVSMAKDGVVYTDEGYDRPYLVRLNYEEMVAVEKMRGHPQGEKDNGCE